tara:strand:+ start:166 stop:1146 length:981 start_codon:yes stop_codon:yes gene_type:complete
MNSHKIKSIAKKVLKVESKAIYQLIDKLNSNFEKSIKAILKCEGRLIILGMGKSGIVAKKIAATMSSTGTPSYFVHPGEAFHGDLGMIQKGDIAIIISNSGETSELIQLINPLKRKNIQIIGMIGNVKSTLADHSDIYLDTSIDKEACTLDLAPTASTTATMALGDAMAISLLEIKGFDKKDFAELHPGGNLGKKLLLKVGDIAHKGSQIPFIFSKTTIKEAILKISEKGLGITGILNDNNEIIGIITDGDIRRGLIKKGNKLFEQTAIDIMSKNPKSIDENILAFDALKIMKKYSITSLFLHRNQNMKKPTGIIHIHDILKLGIK